jgi:hypothetical protein
MACMLQSCNACLVVCLSDHGNRVLGCRDELLEIGRKPGLSTLPQGVNMNVIRCVVRTLYCMIQHAIAARAHPAGTRYAATTVAAACWRPQLSVHMPQPAVPFC